MRRQFNEAFLDDNGKPRVGWLVALAAQIVVLGHTGIAFDRLVDKPESLAIVLTFLIAPDVFKRLLALKYGGK